MAYIQCSLQLNHICLGDTNLFASEVGLMPHILDCLLGVTCVTFLGLYLWVFFWFGSEFVW